MKIFTFFFSFNPLFPPLPDTFPHTLPTQLPLTCSSPTHSTHPFSPTFHLYPTLPYISESYYLASCFVPILTRLCTRAALLAILFLFFGLHCWGLHTIQCMHDTWRSQHTIFALCDSRNYVVAILFLFFNLISGHSTSFKTCVIHLC